MQRDIEDLVNEHRFFEGISPPYRALVAGCGKNVHFEPGQLIATTGAAADRFFAVRAGRVSIEMHAPARGALVLQTAEAGEVVGWSWLFPPYRWSFDVRAIDTVRAIEFDGTCLRDKCERDPAMGYEFMKRFAQVFLHRLEAARLQLLDLYGDVAR